MARLCEAAVELVPAYSLGATTPDEGRLVERMLPHCPDAARELAEYRALAGDLLRLIPPVEAPPPVELLLARVERAERALWDEPARPIAPPTTPVALATSPRPARVGWLLAAASTVLLLIALGALAATTSYWTAQVDALRADQTRVAQSLAVALATRDAPPTMTPTAVPTVKPTVQPTDAPLVLTGAAQHRLLSITPDAGDLAASGVFTWDAREQLGALVVQGLPPLADGQTYQLWLVMDERPLSLGTFSVDADGAGTLIFHSPEPIERYRHIGISVERAAGSPAPTTPHLLLGEI
jgi:anti-sigma-K factor RskA